MWVPMLWRAAPYLLAASAGFSAAWWLQGERLDAARDAHRDYVADQQELVRKAAAANLKLKETADHDYQVIQSKLQTEIEHGEVYRRCVAAGRCGARVVRLSADPGAAGTVAPAGCLDAAGPDAVPAGPGGPADINEAPTVVNDAAVCTLRLNRLQFFIEGQPGY